MEWRHRGCEEMTYNKCEHGLNELTENDEYNEYNDTNSGVRYVHVKKPVSEVFVVEEEEEGPSSREYAVEVGNLTIIYFNLIIDSIDCIVNLFLNTMKIIFTFIQSTVYNFLIAIYNLVSFCAQCFAILPCFCFLFVGKQWGGCSCTNLTQFTLLRQIQVIILTIPLLILFYYLLTWTGILDLIMKQAGYEKVKKTKRLMFSLTTDSNRRFFLFDNLSTLNFFDADINTDDFNVTERETNFLDLLTAVYNNVTIYTEEQVNFTETDAQNINLKDISMYDTVIEYDYASEKNYRTPTSPKHQARKKGNGSVPIFFSRAFDKNDGPSPLDGKEEEHNFEEDAKDFIEQTVNFEEESPRYFVKVTTKATGQIASNLKTDKDKIKFSRPVHEIDETKIVTEPLKTTMDFTEDFLILEEYTTKREVDRDISSYPLNQGGISIYDGFTGTTSKFLKVLQKNLGGSQNYKAPKIKSSTVEVETEQHFVELTESSEKIHLTGEVETTTESPVEFVMLEESTTKSIFEEDATKMTPKTWSIIDEESSTGFEEITEVIKHLEAADT